MGERRLDVIPNLVICKPKQGKGKGSVVAAGDNVTMTILSVEKAFINRARLFYWMSTGHINLYTLSGLKLALISFQSMVLSDQSRAFFWWSFANQ